MQRVAGGDQQAFAALFDRYQQGVARFAFRFVGSRARAEELAQEIFVKLYRGAKSYRPTAAFKTFLFRIATNHCLNEVRRGEYHHEASLELEGAEGPIELPIAGGERPDDAFAGKQMEQVVRAALGKMSERERAAFSMCRFEGMAYRDIAFALSASEAAVKSLIHRATLVVARQLEAVMGVPAHAERSAT